jgi:hypothetical protein
MTESSQSMATLPRWNTYDPPPTTGTTVKQRTVQPTAPNTSSWPARESRPARGRQFEKSPWRSVLSFSLGLRSYSVNRAHLLSNVACPYPRATHAVPTAVAMIAQDINKTELSGIKRCHSLGQKQQTSLLPLPSPRAQDEQQISTHVLASSITCHLSCFWGPHVKNFARGSRFFFAKTSSLLQKDQCSSDVISLTPFHFPHEALFCSQFIQLCCLFYGSFELRLLHPEILISECELFFSQET